LLVVAAHWIAKFGGNNHLISASSETLTKDFFRATVVIDVGCVDQVDACINRRVEDIRAGLHIRVAPRTEHHGSQSDHGDLEVGIA